MYLALPPPSQLHRPSNLCISSIPGFYLIYCGSQLGHLWPNLSLDVACMLFECYYWSFFVTSHDVCVVCWQNHISVTVQQLVTSYTSLQFSASLTGKYRLTFNCPRFFCVSFFLRSVPVVPCPGQRGAVSTMSPASCHQGWCQGLPPPTLLPSLPPAKPTGQRRGWCGCRQRSMDLR